MGESTSRETAIAAGATALCRSAGHTLRRNDPYCPESFDKAVLVLDAALASGGVIPIEEHEAALARHRELFDAALEWQTACRAAEAALARLVKAGKTFAGEVASFHRPIVAANPVLGEAYKAFMAALADTQHPSTPGGTE